jgi:BirA family transcriptional regulator, biotin operon repressor / biotin---[acetyl-CoA-carboxylase] ligase
LPVNLQAILDAPIIEIDTIDSTNNYAMRLIDADTALPGLTIVAREQTAGRGQRGKHWTDVPGESLLMSIVVQPQHQLNDQFAFNACVTNAIVEVMLNAYENWEVQVKWPNDIIINDKKAGGVLIENVLRGNSWAYSIIGFGLNVHQKEWAAELPYATSLAIAGGRSFDMTALRDMLRNKILLNVYQPAPPNEVIKIYNEYLYRRGKWQSFTNEADEWKALICEASADGKLLVRLADGTDAVYTHGTVNWNWENK